MVLVLRLAPLLFATAFLAPDSSLAGEKQEIRVFTGVLSIEGVGGRPNKARITDGKTFLDITEQEYRDRGYIPAFDTLLVRFVRRLPVRIPVPSEQNK